MLFSVSMVGAELYPPVYTNLFSFIMVKYVFGTSHHSLVPLAIILTRSDLRDLIKVVFKKGKRNLKKKKVWFDVDCCIYF